MKVLRGSYTDWDRVSKPTWLTIGVFDGVHIGHQAILAALRRRAGDGAVGVITFEQHPATLLAPERVPPLLTSLEQRLEVIADLGVDVAAVLQFEQVRDLPPGDFVAAIVSGVMNATHIAVGRGFRFGRRMAGDADVLAALGREFGYTVEIIDIVGGDQPISSTAIREALAVGDVTAVRQMLGRPFQLRGSVVVGDHRGHQLGFPTANLEIESNRAIPGHGVYSALTRTADGLVHPSVVNVGVRPTFDGMREIVEVHLIGQELDLYGQELSVDFVGRIRPERRFDGIGQLVEQIGRDVIAARAQLAAQAPADRG